MRWLVTVGVLLASAAAQAQQVEIAPLVGYSTSEAIDRTAPGVDDLRIDRAITWGAQAAYFVTANLGFEALWMRQSTHVSMSSGNVRADVFAMRSTRVHGSLVYQFGEARAAVKPFVFGGFGGNFLSSSDFDTEAKTAWTAGGGLKWFVREHMGVRAQARYNLTDAGGGFCNPFGFCRGSLSHLEISGGAAFRF